MPTTTAARETRVFPLSHVEVRADGDGPPRLVGHAAVFDQLSDPLLQFGGYTLREKIAPGAFRKTLNDGADVRLLINHDGLPLARTRSGTLALREDTIGLALEAELEPTDVDVQRLLPKMARGDVDQMSFAFRVVKDKWELNEDREQRLREEIRTLLEVQLFDVSVVTFPAYPQTDAQVRALLTEAGIDPEALARVVALRRHEEPLSETDRALVRSTVGVLSTYLPEPGGDAHSDSPAPIEPATGHSLALLRRRLRLLELTAA